MLDRREELRAGWAGLRGRGVTERGGRAEASRGLPGGACVEGTTSNQVSTVEAAESDTETLHHCRRDLLCVCFFVLVQIRQNH